MSSVVSGHGPEVCGAVPLSPFAEPATFDRGPPDSRRRLRRVRTVARAGAARQWRDLSRAWCRSTVLELSFSRIT
jgi:hypothetical protein